REGRDHRGHDPELHLAECELRVGRRDDDVGAGDEPAAAAEGVTLYARHHGRRAPVDRVEHRAQPQRVRDVLLARQLDGGTHPVAVARSDGRQRGGVLMKVVALIAAVVLACVAARADAAGSASPGRILYTAAYGSDDYYGSLMAVNANGSGLVRLATYANGGE